MADTESLDFYAGAKEKFSHSHDPEAYRRTASASPPGRGPIRWSERREDRRGDGADGGGGFSGTTVSFVDFKGELPHFIATVLPLLREAGLREGIEDMADLPITLTLADYSRLMPLTSGEVTPDGIDLTLQLGRRGSWPDRAEMLRRALHDLRCRAASSRWPGI